jgi:DNA helicase II / ATP-dependent DNA helicase PcrA
MINQKYDWSLYQKDIFRDISKGTGHTLVIARAGSAKTSSLVEGSRYIPKGKSSLFCAFNKSIQLELKAKLGSYCEAITLHSLGYRAIRNRFGNVEIDKGKCWKIVSSFINDEINLKNNICKTVSLCKSTLSDTPSQIEDLIDKYDIDICDIPISEFITHVIKTIRLCKEDIKTIDFDDMVWHCIVYGIKPGNYDYVFIDESHDLCRSQLELAISACKKDGRIIAVIDPRQAIYQFRGADDQVFDNLKLRLKPKELYLPICYRCPKKVVYLVQKIVPDIQSYVNAIDGEIIDLHINDLQKYAKPGSYVISRLNAPLIRNCLQFLKARIPANILGKDIGENLFSIIKKSKKKSILSFLEWLNKWEMKEKEQLLVKYPRASTDNIVDKAECLRILCEETKSIKDLNDNIESLFKDNIEKDIVLHASIHAIKGKETKDVFVLIDTLRHHSEIEQNCNYVAFSRAKERLFLVYREKPFKQ